MGHVAPCLHSQPFDTPLRAYSGQAVDLQEATSEPGIRVAEYCLVVDLWPLLLSAFAEGQGRKAVDEWDRRTLRSSKSEGRCFGGFRRRNEGTTGLRPWRLHGRGEIDGTLRSCCRLREKTPDPFKILIRLYLRGDICRFAQLSKHDTSQWDERAGGIVGGRISQIQAKIERGQVGGS